MKFSELWKYTWSHDNALLQILMVIFLVIAVVLLFHISDLLVRTWLDYARLRKQHTPETAFREVKVKRGGELGCALKAVLVFLPLLVMLFLTGFPTHSLWEPSGQVAQCLMVLIQVGLITTLLIRAFPHMDFTGDFHAYGWTMRNFLVWIAIGGAGFTVLIAARYIYWLVSNFAK